MAIMYTIFVCLSFIKQALASSFQNEERKMQREF